MAKDAAINVARVVRYRGEGSPEAVEARRELANAKISQYVEKVVASAPPLTDDQCERIGVLLRGGDAR